MVNTRLRLSEVDAPKSLGEKLSEYLARPPQPLLRFYGEIGTEQSSEGVILVFSVRNGLPLPLMYGVYVNINYVGGGKDYISETDHIGPFSTDNWRLLIGNSTPANVIIELGLTPFEIKTDKVEVNIA